MSFKGTAMMAAKVVTKVTKGKAAEAVTKVSKPRVFKESQLSAELGQLVNATTLTRPQALKALWGYIKANDIKKNETGQYITSEPLKPIIGKATFTAPDVIKALSKHVTKIE